METEARSTLGANIDAEGINGGPAVGPADNVRFGSKADVKRDDRDVR
jgi:hypothetical protein